MKEAQHARGRRRSPWARNIVFGLVLLAILLSVQLWRGRQAAVPPAFESSLSMADAFSLAGQDKKPVLVLATADWCAPCQMLKRGALRDTEVSAYITEKTVPVYLDVTKGSTEAGSLGVGMIPVMILLHDGNEVARMEGAQEASRVLAWLETNVQGIP